jgi:trehalose synthase
MLGMHDVDVRPELPERLRPVLPPERLQRFLDTASDARRLLSGRVVWNVNSTATGGGVAEMLQTLVAQAKGVGVDTRWLVMDGEPAFFGITKRLHNYLHGHDGDLGALGEAEHARFAEVTARNVAGLLERVGPRDIVLLHDPQTAGLVEPLRGAGVPVVWRCHIGRDTPNEYTRAGWDFLRRYVAAADAFVFSRREYAPPWATGPRLHVIPPSIDPLSSKNRPLDPEQVAGALALAGMLEASGPPPPVEFIRRDGSRGQVRRLEGVLAGGRPPAPEIPVVAQVSRWDHLKDMAGVMDGFVRYVVPGTDAHLMLVGPAVDGVTDDPEGAEVFAECRQAWAALPASVRQRVHLASVPMADGDENATVVNALQHHASVVVQKSLREGFGLTVTEAMWKSRPVVASAVGGIQDQIVDGLDGVLLPDPHDLEAFGTAVRGLLADPVRATRMGEAARRRVEADFLGDRHLIQYASLFARLMG